MYDEQHSDAWLHLWPKPYTLCPAGAVGDASLLHTAKPESLGASLSVRARSGGFLTQLAFAGAHLGVHLGAAICLMLLLELATETFIRCAPWLHL